MIGRRILIADDEETFLRATADLLRGQGYDCHTAADGMAAADLLRQLEFDLVIADIKMPGNAELELVKSMSELETRIPVLIVTGYPSLESAIQAITLPVAAYLVKPVDFEELLKQVEFSLEGSDLARIQRLEQGLRRTADDLRRLAPSAESPRPARQLTEIEELQELSTREWEVLRCLLDSLGIDGSATRLEISPHTVRNHIKSILRKAQVRSQSELLTKILTGLHGAHP